MEAARLKPVTWMGSSKSDLRAFPADAEDEAGYQLYRIQQGLEPLDWKPLSTVGSGVREVRVHTIVEHRVVYVAKFEEAVYVLHAFAKRTRKTNQSDLDLARRRYAEVVALRAVNRRR
jgi:phage-related protein